MKLNYDYVSLQEARKRAAERFEAIGMAHLPSGWTFVFRKSLSGRCYTRQKRISAPRPVTRKSLYIWRHECAHAHNVGKGEPRHVEEMRAEQWAHERMREAGVPVPRAMTKRAKRYVGRKIEQALARGAKRISREAERYAA